MNLYQQGSGYVSKCLPLMAFTLLTTQVLLAQQLAFRTQFRTGDFPLVRNNTAATILVSTDDFKVAQIAAADFASDVERVTGTKPALKNNAAEKIDEAVIIGTLGKSPLIDSIAGKLDVSRIRGKWECYIIATVERPTPNIKSALVIIGSDRRGTAYGVYEVSQMIGVSPWYWWADVTPEHKANLIIGKGAIVSHEPSVKYRGIFINDEDWGLHPWAAKTFEPEFGAIGPKTYQRVFELLLRLKANTLWPAMHEISKPFNITRANPELADDYAIVMGASHAEPMLRSNPTEWKTNKDDYNFVSNPDGVTAYWEERVRDNGKFENIYTVGMRGIHDSPIVGTKTQAERIPLLEKIFSVQRGLLAKHVNPNVENVPQIFCPYKEVLADYRAGLKVPDDVTIVFPDDNFGYIRQFPNAEEQKRKGGFGVYYHISYLGRPIAYLWLNSSPPAMIWEEMNKAYENGMRKLWIVNVGDIKPGEIGMEFFLQMAYDANRWTIDTQHEFLREWATREFGSEHSAEIASIMDEYYRLGFQRKPEHLQWYIPNDPPRLSALAFYEISNRLSAYDRLTKRVDVMYELMPAAKRDAFYELVVFPARSAALANERFFTAELANNPNKSLAEADGVNNWAQRSIAADKAIATETKYFNETLAGGKWRGIMSPEMNPGQWPSLRVTPPKVEANSAGNISYLPPAYHPGFRIDNSVAIFRQMTGIVSIEAENYRRSNASDNFSWRVIKGLGKTGDSISVFPADATTFSRKAPSVEYEIEINADADFDAYFYLLPTQPLVPGNGLRIAFSIDGGEPHTIVVDKDTEVSSHKWMENILGESTIGTAKVKLTKGRHTLSMIAVDSGVVLDKIVLASQDVPTSYFGPMETRFVKD